jgi:hypothetical protein
VNLGASITPQYSLTASSFDSAASICADRVSHITPALQDLTLAKSDLLSITMARCSSPPLGRHVYIAAAVLMCTIALLSGYAQADVNSLLA